MCKHFSSYASTDAALDSFLKNPRSGLPLQADPRAASLQWQTPTLDVDKISFYCYYHPVIAPEPTPLETQRDAAWKLEEFVQEVNTRLLARLPSDQYDARQREDFSVRLLRHYSSLGLVDESERIGREALYRYRHLLQVLCLRTLQREGWNSKAIAGFCSRDSGELEAFLNGRDPALQSELEEFQASRAAPRAAAPTQATLEKTASSPTIARSAAPSRNISQAISQKSAKLEVADQMPALLELKEESGRESALDFLQGLRARRSLSPTQAMPAPLPAFLLHDPPRQPERWKRTEIAPGLELHVSDRYRRARSSSDKNRLLEVIGTTLETALFEPTEST